MVDGGRLSLGRGLWGAISWWGKILLIFASPGRGVGGYFNKGWAGPPKSQVAFNCLVVFSMVVSL